MNFDKDSSGLQRTMAELPDLVIEGELGRGGMGIVYKGYQPLLDRFVAVKLLNVDQNNSALLDRFRREARLLATLAHPNIVACYSAGTNDEGRMYLVMEYVDGPTLHDFVERNGPLAPAQALHVILQLATALEYAQAQSIIHRDIKPENVLLRTSSQTSTQVSALFPFTPKLVDLGLARIQADAVSQPTQLTQAGTVMGTPTTMAPEMFNDPENVDFRADIYGLGCVLYQMLTARRLYANKPLSQIMHAKFNEDPPLASDALASIPPEVARFAALLMARKREDRPQSYGQVISECRRLALSDPSVAPVRKSGSPKVLVLAAAGALALVGLIAGGVAMRGTSESSDSAPAVVSPVPAAPITVVESAPVATPLPTPEPTPIAEATPAPTPAPVLWNEDGLPMFASSFESRLAGWDAPSAGSNWGASEDDEVAVVGTGSGRIARAVPSTPWSVQGDTRIINAREFSVGALLPDGGSVVAVVQDLGGVRIARMRQSGSPSGVDSSAGPITLGSTVDIAWRVRYEAGTLHFEIDGTPLGELAVGEAPPTHLLLSVAGGSAVFLDLTLHTPHE